MHLKNTREEGSWMKSDQIINKWLEERQQVIVTFNRLLTLMPFNDRKSIAKELEAFTNLLIDYVSAGQFQVFETIFDAAQSHPEYHVKKSVVVDLLQTTNIALNFSDIYGNPENSIENLKYDLEVLANAFATRMDLEDELIQLYSAVTHLLENS